MEIDRIVADLRREAERIAKAISALLGSAGTAGKRGPAGKGTQKRRRRGRLTPEGRRRLSEAMKKRWAERRKMKKG